MCVWYVLNSWGCTPEFKNELSLGTRINLCWWLSGPQSHTDPVKWCSTDTKEKKEKTKLMKLCLSKFLFMVRFEQAQRCSRPSTWLIVQLWICESQSVFPDEVTRVTGREKEWNGREWDRHDGYVLKNKLHTTLTIAGCILWVVNTFSVCM